MSWNPVTTTVKISSALAQRIQELVADTYEGRRQLTAEEFLADANIYAYELPYEIRQVFHNFKQCHSYHAVCIHLDIHDREIARTPKQHRSAGEAEYIGLTDVLHLLFASLLGEPFAWSTIQNGYILNDVMPVQGHDQLAASSGFASNFGLHTEDAFHPWAGDYLGLLCLRNPDAVPTVVAGFDANQLSPPLLEALFEPRFIVGANVAQHVERVSRPSPILFGDRTDPYLRINVNATYAVPGDKPAEEALSALVKVLQENSTPLVFKPGDFWYIDNLRVAHGRDRFQPRFDGQDRWLRRLYISSAYRYTRGLRDDAASRVLDPKRTTWNLCL